MNNRFENKVVLVTGATAGIGRAIAAKFACEGAHVVICSRKLAAVEKTKVELNCEGIACNVSKEDDRRALLKFIIDKYGKLDILILNAATSLSFGVSEDCDEAKWDKMMDTNLKSSWIISKMFVPIMSKEIGSIVLLSSFAGFNPNTPIGVYGVTKTALIGLTKLLANEYGRKYKIRVNAVAPGVIKTNFSKSLWETEEIRATSEAISPLGRVGTAEEVAGPVTFLASQDASYITGECIVIAGGTHCRL